MGKTLVERIRQTLGSQVEFLPWNQCAGYRCHAEGRSG